MDQLLTLTPRARKGEIDYLLGLGKFDEARDGAQAAYGKLLEQTEALKAEATEESISQARESLQSQEKNAQEAAASCEALAKKSAELAAELEKKAAGLTLLEKTRKEWAAKKRECDMLRGAAERLARETEGKTRVSKAELSQLEIAQKGKEGDLLAAKEEAKKARKAHEEAVNELAAIQSEAKASSERKGRQSFQKGRTGNRLNWSLQRQKKRRRGFPRSTPGFLPK
jgi:chromosome segregation ATPase